MHAAVCRWHPRRALRRPSTSNRRNRSRGKPLFDQPPSPFAEDHDGDLGAASLMYNQPDSVALKQDVATSPVSSEGVTNFLEWSSMMATRTVLKASRRSALLAVFVMVSAVSFAAESSVESNVV